MPNYNAINSSINTILSLIPHSHVTEYDWLIGNLRDCLNPDYQKRYSHYWMLNAARLTPDFKTKYFVHLNNLLNSNPFLSSPFVNLKNIVNYLYSIPTHKNGRKTLQFSFATKMFHMMNPFYPIFDSLVAKFYGFKSPGSNISLTARINKFMLFYEFLVKEYRFILCNGVLQYSINAFKNRFNPENFTDEKIIDSLIWAFVAAKEKGLIDDSNSEEGVPDSICDLCGKSIGMALNAPYWCIIISKEHYDTNNNTINVIRSEEICRICEDCAKKALKKGLKLA